MIIVQTLLVPIFLVGNLRSRAKKRGKRREISPLGAGFARARDDAIEIATMLLRLGVIDPAIDETIEYILSKRNERGRWLLEATPSNMYTTWGVPGDESKWVTFRAMRMLTLAGRLDDL